MGGRLSAFIWGGLIGAAVGVLFAPKSGKETREDLKRRADEYYEQGLESYTTQKERVLEAVDVGRRSALEKSEELKGKILETRERLMSQVDNAAETAKKKINIAVGKVKDEAETAAPETSE